MGSHGVPAAIQTETAILSVSRSHAQSAANQRNFSSAVAVTAKEKVERT
jgi:hypothetical protein